MYYSKLVFSFAFSAIALSSCSKHDALPQSPEPSIELTEAELVALDNYANGSAVSENEALEYAGSIMEQLDSYSLTKGSSPRYVSSITPIKRNGVVGTKADDEDVAYIVNFGDSLGYSVLSADRRTDDVFLISPSGNLNIETLEQDYLDGKIPASTLLMMSNISAVMDAQIESYERTADELEASALEKIGAADGNTKAASTRKVTVTTNYSVMKAERLSERMSSEPVRSEVTTDWSNVASGSVQPMIKTQWGQEYPFYNQTPVVDGKQALTGCEITAMVQLMSYWEYPRNYDWKSLKSHTYMVRYDNTPQSVRNEAARLMHEVGVATGVEYGSEWSGANHDGAIGYFRNAGYKNPGVKAGYDANRVLSSLYKGFPVLMAGYSFKNDLYLKIWFIKIRLYTAYELGHCWVIDGVIRQKKTTTVYLDDVISSQRDTYRSLFHCNFGNYGLTDGYYASDCFDSNNALIDDVIGAGDYIPGGTKGLLVGESQGTDKYYQFELEGVYDIQAY